MAYSAHPIETLFPELKEYTSYDFRRIGTEKPTLMIAMTARTGSSHLCSGLSSVLPIGDPTEILNGRDTLIWEKKRRNIQTFAEFLAHYIKESGAYIVFKTNWIDFSFFRDSIFHIFRNLKFIYLDRLDIEAQAVSLFKATVTGTWHHSSTIRMGKTIPEDELKKKFDLLQICHIIDELQREKIEWENFFFVHEIQPVRIFYEHFASDLAIAIHQIVQHLDHGALDNRKLASTFSKMADLTNDDWITKVRNYRNGNFYRRYGAGQV